MPASGLGRWFPVPAIPGALLAAVFPLVKCPARQFQQHSVIPWRLLLLGTCLSFNAQSRTNQPSSPKWEWAPVLCQRPEGGHRKKQQGADDDDRSEQQEAKGQRVVPQRSGPER